MPRLLLTLWLTLSSTTSNPNYQTLHQLIKASFRYQQRPPKRFKNFTLNHCLSVVFLTYTLTIKEDTLFLVLFTIVNTLHNSIQYNSSTLLVTPFRDTTHPLTQSTIRSSIYCQPSLEIPGYRHRGPIEASIITHWRQDHTIWFSLDISYKPVTTHQSSPSSPQTPTPHERKSSAVHPHLFSSFPT
jgi:hypothetical protein